ncbi:hypothetical protein I5W42_11335 [Stenotrophomonas maltophilia]|uniref:AbiJ-NTD4 domain-containing protein n=1 Tax=Stenotrophomonas geniculata TaxID=86188 RepID=UPI000F81AD54|nr:hypothetical protein [Stenotrophomonas geniculata]MBH1832045.1 hypothetical protein [Stenotrophomonas maltophilia]RTY17799.1 hypothetical protein EKT70_02020 [Stenotrophomonas geniculata]
MLNTFSRRHRLDYVEAPLHYEAISSTFRMELCNVLIGHAHENGAGTLSEYQIYRFLSLGIHRRYEKFMTEDDIYEFYTSDLLADLLQSCEWHEVLSIIEVAVYRNAISADEANGLLRYHNMGYELVSHPGGWIIEVKYGSVVEEVERAIEATESYPKINDLIKAARKNLSDPQNIEVENSIKNSMQAIEGFVIEWLDQKHGKKASTLGDAVKILKKMPGFDQHVIESLHQFYIFRNRTPNVGHGSVKNAPVDASEALLFNDMAASFINYFARKSP